MSWSIRAACRSARSTKAPAPIKTSPRQLWRQQRLANRRREKFQSAHYGQAVETGRNDGQVSYALKVHVDKNAPAGYLNDHLMFATNDQNGSQIPVEVEGRVMPGITVSPTALFMGVVQPGQTVTKQLVVKGKKPFRILGVSCDDKSFKFDTSKETSRQGIAPGSRDVSGRRRCGQGRQDDQDQDRPGPDDARASGLRGRGCRTVVGAANSSSH